MKKFLLPLMLITGIIYSCTEARDQKEKAREVNAVLGDASFVSKYGSAPDETTDEDLRISTHLEFVEKLLRSRSVAGFTEGQKAKRSALLDLLHQYRTIGIFPRNYDHTERKPCFIDKEGRICAVGYLVEKTAGREAAETINKDYKYAEIPDMHSPLVDQWIASSGLTKEECAMIQPSYGGPTENRNTISKGYAVPTSIMTGVNLSATAINSSQLGKPRSKGVAVAGLLTGTTQLVYGISKYPKPQTDNWGYTITNEKDKTLSMINIGLGTTSVLISTWNLITNRKPQEKKIAWSLDGVDYNNEPGLAFTLRRKL